MVAKIDEQQMPVVALAMNPAREPAPSRRRFGAQLAAGMGAVGVHVFLFLIVIPAKAEIALPQQGSAAPACAGVTN